MVLPLNQIKFDYINNYLLFGGGDLLIKFAKHLQSKNIDVLVITSKRHFSENLLFDNNHGFTFGKKLNDYSINFLISKDVSEDSSVQSIISNNTIGFSFGAAWIFKKQFIDLFDGKLLNLHGSRLPIDRGGGGFSWRIMRGDKSGRSLIHQISPGTDTGAIIDYNDYIFPKKCRIPLDYYQTSIKKDYSFLKNFLTKINRNEKFELKNQNERISTYWPRLNTDIHGYIDWSNNLQDVQNFICAFDDPYQGASSYINGVKVRLKKVFLSKSDGIFHPFQNGLVYRKINDAIMVSVAPGSLKINEVLDDKGENIISDIVIGDRFYTPIEKIEKALKFRAVYTPDGLKPK